MEKFIPYEKLSKKQKKARDVQKRGKWGISPVTRRPENPKAYKRKKTQEWDDESAAVSFFILPARSALSGTCFYLRIRI